MAKRLIPTNGETRRLRLAKHFSQEGLAKLAKVSERKIVDIEAGVGAEADIIISVGVALGIPQDQALEVLRYHSAAESPADLAPAAKLEIWLYGDSVIDEKQFVGDVATKLPPGAHMSYKDYRKGNSVVFTFIGNAIAARSIFVLFFDGVLASLGVYKLRVTTIDPMDVEAFASWIGNDIVDRLLSGMATDEELKEQSKAEFYTTLGGKISLDVRMLQNVDGTFSLELEDHNRDIVSNSSRYTERDPSDAVEAEPELESDDWT